MLVSLCPTEWLILASDDDVYNPHFLEEIDRLARKYPEVDLIHARAQLIDCNGAVTRRDALYEERVTQAEFMQQLFYLNHTECIANHALRTQALRSMGGFVNLPLAWISDTATTWAMARNGAANTRDTLFSFRLSGENISSHGAVFGKQLTGKTTATADTAILRDKLRAGLMFDDFALQLFADIEPGDDTIQCDVCNYLRRTHGQHIYTLTYYLAEPLPFADYRRWVSHMRRRGYIRGAYPFYQLWKKWLWHKIHKHR